MLIGQFIRQYLQHDTINTYRQYLDQRMHKPIIIDTPHMQSQHISTFIRCSNISIRVMSTKLVSRARIVAEVILT